MVVPLDHDGKVVHSQADFVNEQILDSAGTSVADATVASAVESYRRTQDTTTLNDTPEQADGTTKIGPKIMYEITSEDGFKAESEDATSLWKQVFEAVQEARLKHSLAPLPINPLGQTGLQMLGLTHDALAYLIEQLPRACETREYQFKHHKQVRYYNIALVLLMI